ncbi:hypothetical protein GPECTOR_4g830 [Gonium pectorale]|uniref:Uncharacterized protein n=1 Tax=Gonium pectorale TaxID=33097 RepID=A0A150GZK5_GONPE|nr:hypothetical protein GPECTOR_4g830 [Gonium pectorale]|eukprot:KXZ54760.1 hypothetical protein GPECTOR_4g830 [Gonium pectorale]
MCPCVEQTVDEYYGRRGSNYDICVIPGPNLTWPYGKEYRRDVCGGEGGVLRVPLKDMYSPSWDTDTPLADAYIYRTYSSADSDSTQSLLYVTVAIRPAAVNGTQLYYAKPSPDLTESSPGEDLFLGVSSSLYVWTDARTVSYKQYVNPMVYDGIYACHTFVLNLKRICDPNLSYINPAHRGLGEACTCRPGVAACPPADISGARNLFIVISVNAIGYPAYSVQVPFATCALAPGAEDAPQRVLLSSSNGRSNVVQFALDPRACENPPPSPPQPPSPPLRTRPRPPSPRPPPRPRPPPDYSVSASISVTSLVAWRTFGNADCEAGNRAAKPYTRGRTVGSQCSAEVVNVDGGSADGGGSARVTWDFFFDSAANLRYFFASVSLGADGFWADMFASLDPGCGAVGGYTDSVYNRNGVLGPVPLSQRDPSRPQPFCVAGYPGAGDECWFSLADALCSSPLRPPPPPSPPSPRPPGLPPPAAPPPFQAIVTVATQSATAFQPNVCDRVYSALAPLMLFFTGQLDIAGCSVDTLGAAAPAPAPAGGSRHQLLVRPPPAGGAAGASPRPAPSAALTQLRVFVITAPAALGSQQRVAASMIPGLCADMVRGMRLDFEARGWQSGVHFALQPPVGDGAGAGGCPVRAASNGRLQFNVTAQLAVARARELVAVLGEPAGLESFVSATGMLCGTKLVVVKPGTQEVLLERTKDSSPMALSPFVEGSACRRALPPV